MSVCMSVCHVFAYFVENHFVENHFGRWENYFGRWKIYFGSWKSDFQSKAPNGAEQESEMFSSRLACQGLVIIIIRMHYALWP